MWVYQISKSNIGVYFSTKICTFEMNRTWEIFKQFLKHLTRVLFGDELVSKTTVYAEDETPK